MSSPTSTSTDTSPSTDTTPGISIMRYSPIETGSFDWSDEPWEVDQVEKTTTNADNNGNLSPDPDSSSSNDQKSASLPDTNSSSNSSDDAQTTSLLFPARESEPDGSHGLASEPENIPSPSPATSPEQNQSGDHLNEPTSTSDDANANSPLSETTEPALDMFEPVPEYDFNFEIPWYVGMLDRQLYTAMIRAAIDERRGTRPSWARSREDENPDARIERRFTSALRYEAIIEEDRYRVYEAIPQECWSEGRLTEDGRFAREFGYSGTIYASPVYEEPVEWTVSRSPSSRLYQPDPYLDNGNLTPEEIEKRDLILLAQRVWWADDRRKRDFDRRFASPH